MTAWMYVFYNPVFAGPIYAYFGYLLEQELKSHYKINAPYLWWLTLIVGAPFVAFLAWRGLALSVKVLVGLGLTEMAIVFSLALSGFASPGPGGFNFSSWVPSHSLSGEGFALAVVFSLQALTGWEAAAPLAEETSNPRRNVPRATMISIIGLGIFLVIMYWGQIIGWGTSLLTGSSPHALVNAPDLPGLAIAQRLWGGAWVVVLGAMFSSTLAVCQACNNVSTRIWFKMGETGTLPAWFGHVHPVHKTPTHAILANLLVSSLAWPRCRLWCSQVVLLDQRPRARYGCDLHLHLGQCRRLLLLPERTAGGVQLDAALHPADRVHGCPIYVTIKSFQPYPAFPYDLAPLIDGVWLVVGLGILTYLWASKKDQWIDKLGAAAVESDSIPTIAEDLPAGRRRIQGRKMACGYASQPRRVLGILGLCCTDGALSALGAWAEIASERREGVS